MSGILYFVPTPIGNLEDMTFRAVKILKEVDYILCEDTRTSGILLKHFEISKPLKSYHLHNEHQATLKVIEDLKNGQNIAIITDAGTPGISAAEKGETDKTETAGGGEKNDSPLRKSAQDKHYIGADKGVFR